MKQADLLRYGLWCGIVVTAEGNRREYHMTTTWLPHLATNTLSLLLPDVYRLLFRPKPDRASAKAGPQSVAGEARDLMAATLTTMLCDRPDYALYVAPLALGYLLSSPWLNIYKGDLGEMQLAGFGLDALPHISTAFALTALVHDAAQIFGELARDSDAFGAGAQWLDRHKAAVSATILALATLLWELGEHRIYKHELTRRGSLDSINMQWSAHDTAYDCAANAIGWLLATTWGARKHTPK